MIDVGASWFSPQDPQTTVVEAFSVVDVVLSEFEILIDGTPHLGQLKTFGRLFLIGRISLRWRLPISIRLFVSYELISAMALYSKVLVFIS